MPQNRVVPTEVLIARYEAGETFQQIADAYHVSRQALAERYKRLGRQARPKRVPTYPRIACLTCGRVFRLKRADRPYCSLKCVPPDLRDQLSYRKQTCKRGHPRTPENLYPSQDGKSGRRCKICTKEARDRKKKEKQRGQL